MSLQLFRVMVGPDKNFYISDNVTHRRLYHHLLHDGPDLKMIYKLRNNYHLGIL